MENNFILDTLGVETYADLLFNLGIIAAVAAAAYVIFRVGVYLINNYFTRVKSDFVDDELRKFILTSLKTVLKYGLIFLVIMAALEIFKIDVIGASEIRLAGTTIIKIIAILILARIVLGVGKQLITHLFEKSKIKKQIMSERRRYTLSGLLRNVLTYVVCFIAAIMILENLGVKTSSILAGVGVAGLAISFGAQSLIKDIITGFFIMFEDQYNTGDFITAAGVTGYVEVLGLRTTKIKEWTGELHVIPNGEITQIKNYSKNNITGLIFMDIAYEEDIDEAIDLFEKEGEKAFEELEILVEKPKVHGVVDLGDSYVRIRIGAPSIPGFQWMAERDLTRRFKKALDREGIEIPYPRRVLINQDNKEKD